MGVKVARIPLVVAVAVLGRLCATVLAAPLARPVGVPGGAGGTPPGLGATLGRPACIVCPMIILPPVVLGWPAAARVCCWVTACTIVLGDSALMTWVVGAAADTPDPGWLFTREVWSDTPEPTVAATAAVGKPPTLMVELITVLLPFWVAAANEGPAA